MLSITGRMELSYWSGFEVCGGERAYGNDPGFESPALRIAECFVCGAETSVDARKYAKVVHLVDDDDLEGVQEERDFAHILQDVVHDKNPGWKLVGFRVFPDAVELRYASRSHDFQLVHIEKRVFRINIVVPATDDSEGPTETFGVEIDRSFDGEYHANISRSGDRNIRYAIWYDNTLEVLTPKPTNKVLKFLAKLLFPDFYSKGLSCINYQYGAFKRMYLEIWQDMPILAKNENAVANGIEDDSDVKNVV